MIDAVGQFRTPDWTAADRQGREDRSTTQQRAIGLFDLS